MNRRVCVWAGSIVGAAVCGWALGGGTALAQAIPPVAAPPPIPTGSVPTPVRTAWANPNLAQARAAISPFMAAQLGTIGSAGATATNQTAARLSLILACTRGNTTAAYYQAYATEWAQQAGPILKNPATPVRVKIDVGVVTASVAATTNGSTLLTPIIDQLLSDPNPAVADWGMKAARPVIITLLAQSGGPGTSTLIGDVVKSATDHARDLSGVVAEDAYQALVITAPAAAFGAAAPPPLTPLFDPVLKLLAVRTKRYAAGLVPAPDAEESGAAVPQPELRGDARGRRKPCACRNWSTSFPAPASAPTWRSTRRSSMRCCGRSRTLPAPSTSWPRRPTGGEHRQPGHQCDARADHGGHLDGVPRDGHPRFRS